MRILESTAGQKYAVDDEFLERLYNYPGVYTLKYHNNHNMVTAGIADIIDFLTEEGLI